MSERPKERASKAREGKLSVGSNPTDTATFFASISGSWSGRTIAVLPKPHSNWGACGMSHAAPQRQRRVQHHIRSRMLVRLGCETMSAKNVLVSRAASPAPEERTCHDRARDETDAQ